VSLEIINILKKMVKGIRILQDRISAIEGAPAGVIVMWSGTLATIPDGWVLCDGGNGTPDLRQKFVMGAPAATNPGGTGGANSITLAIANLPSHTHGKGTLGADSAGAHTHGEGTLGADSVGSHTHSYNDYYTANQGLLTAEGTWGTHWAVGADHARTTGPAGGHSHTVSGSTASGGAHPHTISGSTASTGGGTAFDNRPAYYEIAYIMKL